jgi:hypothetical protein
MSAKHYLAENAARKIAHILRVWHSALGQTVKRLALL